MIRPFNPITYVRYLACSSGVRTQKIFDLITHDPFYGGVLEDLENFGYEIKYPFWGGGGSYQSEALHVSQDDFKDEFLRQHAAGAFKAKFALPPRYGLEQNAFYFLHELTHFYQDMLGLFFTPLQKTGQPEANLDEESWMAVILFNESMAAVEAIRGASRIGGAAWQGALGSMDWGRLARKYAKDLEAGAQEQQAAESLLNAWHNSRQRPYYERKARLNVKKDQGLLHVGIGDLLALLPDDARWHYIRNFYGQPERQDSAQNFPHGSPVYLWHSYID